MKNEEVIQSEIQEEAKFYEYLSEISEEYMEFNANIEQIQLKYKIFNVEKSQEFMNTNLIYKSFDIIKENSIEMESELIAISEKSKNLPVVEEPHLISSLEETLEEYRKSESNLNELKFELNKTELKQEISSKYYKELDSTITNIWKVDIQLKEVELMINETEDELEKEKAKYKIYLKNLNEKRIEEFCTDILLTLRSLMNFAHETKEFSVIRDQITKVDVQEIEEEYW